MYNDVFNNQVIEKTGIHFRKGNENFENLSGNDFC